MSRMLTLLVIAATFVACGGDSKGASPPETSSSTTSATTSPPPAYDAATATPQERLERFRFLEDDYGADNSTQDYEAPHVAANVCDNVVSDFKLMIDFMAAIPGDLRAKVIEKLAMVDAYCPDHRLQLEAAADDYGITELPSPAP